MSYYAVKDWIKYGGKYQNLMTPIEVDGIRGDGNNYAIPLFRDRIKCLLNAFECNVLNRL